MAATPENTAALAHPNERFPLHPPWYFDFLTSLEVVDFGEAFDAAHVVPCGLTSVREFERMMATDPSTLTDLELAARFLYLQRTAYGGKVTGRSFGVSPGGPGRFDVGRLAPVLDELHDQPRWRRNRAAAL